MLRRRRVSPAHRPEHEARLWPRTGQGPRVHRRARAGWTLHVCGGRFPARNRRIAAALSAAAPGPSGAGIGHRRTFSRLDAVADVRPRAAGRPVDRVVCACLGRTRLRARREVRDARQARPAHPFARGRRAWRQHRCGLQERAVRVEPGHRPRRVGRVRPHAGHGDAWCRPSGLVAPLVCRAGRRRSARPVRARGRHARRHRRTVHRAHRTRADGAVVEPGTLGIARVLQDTGRSGNGGGDAARAQDPLRCPHARRACRLECRYALRLRMGSRALSRSVRGAGAHQGAPAAHLRLGIPLRLDSFTAVRRARRAALPALDARWRTVRVRLGHFAPVESVRQRADAAAGERHRRLHAPRGVRVVARRAREAVCTGRRRHQERFRRARARRRGRVQRRSGAPPAQCVSTALQPLRLRGDRSLPAAGQRAADRLGARRLDRQPALSAFNGAATRRATGRGSRRRFAGDCRGG